MKKILLPLVLVFIAVPTVAQAQPGALDPSFGQRGRLALKLPVRELELFYTGKPRAARMTMDALPSGGLAAASGAFVIERTADGRPLKRFGGDGKVRIQIPSGSTFELGDLAVDPQGRVLVAGTQYTRSQTPLRRAVIFRYLANGDPDPSFGADGVVNETFDQQPALDPTGAPSPGGFNVGLTGLALAPDGGIVVGGYSAAQVIMCSAGAPVGATSRAFLARLTVDGSRESSFGEDGVLTDEGTERISPPVLDPSGRIGFEAASGGYCGFRGPAESGKFVSLLADGQPDAGFGSNGGRPHPNLTPVTDVAFDSRGRLLALGQRPETAELEGGIGDPEWRVRRLLSDGRPDPSFGRDGSASPKLPPQAHLEDLTIDHRGRIALAGYRTDKWNMNARFLLTRLSRDGRREPGFGRGGWAVTRFLAGEAAAIEVTADGRDRLLVGGILGDPRYSESNGLAFARFSGR
ncbi:MAG TPA: hypothetical protein VNC16_00340 [Solirubrobacterales bacterium]|jgi:uncharacterized delta-60 repeat protein|nr:hypothetical protein [Solirubrobacterales bacterium]